MECKECGKPTEHYHVGFLDGVLRYRCKECCKHPQCVEEDKQNGSNKN